MGKKKRGDSKDQLHSNTAPYSAPSQQPCPMESRLAKRRRLIAVAASLAEYDVPITSFQGISAPSANAELNITTKNMFFTNLPALDQSNNSMGPNFVDIPVAFSLDAAHSSLRPAQALPNIHGAETGSLTEVPVVQAPADLFFASPAPNSVADIPVAFSLGAAHSSFRPAQALHNSHGAETGSLTDVHVVQAPADLFFASRAANSDPSCLQSNISGSPSKAIQYHSRINKRQDPKFSNIAGIPTKPYVFPPVPPCSFCMAKRFPREPPTFCCSNGQVKLISHDPPPELWDLYTGTTPLSKEFRTYVRTYNNHFAFTSLGVKWDRDLCRRNNGIYTFKALGQFYHYLNSLLPNGVNPSYLQLYYYDTEHELENRLRTSDRMNVLLVNAILKIMENNPYSQFFRSLADHPNLEECSVVIKNVASLDQRVYNAPTSSQVAAIWVESDNETASNRDIIIFSKQGSPIRIWYYYGCYDSLQYPLLFPLGEPGWHQGIKRATVGGITAHEEPTLPEVITSSNIDNFLEAEYQVMQEGGNSRDNVSCREYCSYKLQIRPGQQSVLLHAGRLFQQYAVDMYIKLESSRLDYFAHQQKRIRAELYSGIVDSIAIGERRGFKIGKRIVLPATFIGGPRDMCKRYLDAMTLVQRYGKPDLFITMTCNPNWSEIKQELLPGEETQNRPDLLARVFRSKFEEFKIDVLKKHIFGQVIAYVYVIEFQKRGLPHMHMLLILNQSNKIKSPDQYDKYVSAEIPNENEHPHLRRAVWKHMIHGPCGQLNPHNVCMKINGLCKNHYPKDFCQSSSQTEDSYPLYRRRDDGQTIDVRGRILNNQWVIPYNPFLLAKFDCHLNVEVCSTVKAVKYLYKYIYKGHDRVAFNVVGDTQSIDINEIERFREGRWIGPPEAMWRIYKFTLNEVHPSVLALQLHLENGHSVTYADDFDLQDLVGSPMCKKTTLTEYFALNQVSPEARKLLYCQFPEYYVWNRPAKTWKVRKQGFTIGRLVSVSPIEGERYYLKLLLSHIKGAISFQDLKKFQGLLCQTFKEAAILHGLVQEDDCFRHALAEASTYQMPRSLRRLFSTLLVYCNPVNAPQLWEEFSHVMSEDFAHQRGVNQHTAKKMCLREISYQLDLMGKNINEYLLVDGHIAFDEAEHSCKEIDDEQAIQVSPTDINNVEALNEEQRLAYELILQRVLSNQHGSFFIDGPGGTGKSFLYNALLATVRSKGLIALATASSGVAASVLSGGRTAHSRFKLPLNIEDQMTCSIKKQSGLAKLLRLSNLIIWDEAPMIRRQAIESFERMLRDVTDCDQPFGGKVVVFGGDFRQVLPIVPKGSVTQTIAASLVKSFLWPLLTKIRLKHNMRAQSDITFANFLLRVGDGTVETVLDDNIILPTAITLPYDNAHSIDALINLTFPNLNNYSESLDSIIGRAILSTKNEFVDEVNDKIINRFPGEFHEYISFDTAIESSQQGLHENFFNNMTPSGFPPHVLKLKKNCPIILLRNIDPSNGLCNGTRLICKSFNRNVIGATIASGAYRDKHVFLPRIPLTPATGEINAFPFQRAQFPVRLCFCMTINKAQGQTLDFVGVYLPQPVFSHGQLYVALSRAKTSSTIAMLAIPQAGLEMLPVHTRNVVYKEVLLLAAAD